MNTLPITTDLFSKEFFLPLQALTWKLPFAAPMLHGKIETRSWNTLYRGLVLICAGLEEYKEENLILTCTTKQIKQLKDISESDQAGKLMGVAIAVGRLVNTRVMAKKDQEKAFVKYNSGLFVHIYEDVSRIEPFKFTGVQKWKTVDDQKVLSKITFI